MGGKQIPEKTQPRHIAMIMDGNGRWARKRHLPRLAGHARGVKRVRDMVEACIQRGIPYLTLFAFSTENWKRPLEEVNGLMRLFVEALEREVNELQANGVRLRVVGDISAFDARVRELIQAAEARTASNEALTLTIAANYGGRWDIRQALLSWVSDQFAVDANSRRWDWLQVMNRIEQARPAGEALEAGLSERLAMAYAPDPDLLIRTGGECRISNFLLWQMAYTELYFTDTYWPDFSAKSLDVALRWYAHRERRYGQTSAQLAQSPT